MGRNASAQTHYLSLSGLEVYGKVTRVYDELGKAAKEPEDQHGEAHCDGGQGGQGH